MRIAIQISKWTDPYVARFLWSRGDDKLNTEYRSASRGSGPPPLLSIWIKRRKDRYFGQQACIDKSDVYYALGVLGIFFTIGAIVFLKRWIS